MSGRTRTKSERDAKLIAEARQWSCVPVGAVSVQAIPYDPTRDQHKLCDAIERVLNRIAREHRAKSRRLVGDGEGRG